MDLVGFAGSALVVVPASHVAVAKAAAMVELLSLLNMHLLDSWNRRCKHVSTLERLTLLELQVSVDGRDGQLTRRRFD
jgi:hypothetical protein